MKRKRGCVEEGSQGDVDVSAAEMEFESRPEGKEDVQQDDLFVRRDGENIAQKTTMEKSIIIIEFRATNTDY